MASLGRSKQHRGMLAKLVQCLAAPLGTPRVPSLTSPLPPHLPLVLQDGPRDGVPVGVSRDAVVVHEDPAGDGVLRVTHESAARCARRAGAGAASPIRHRRSIAAAEQLLAPQVGRQAAVQGCDRPAGALRRGRQGGFVTGWASWQADTSSAAFSDMLCSTRGCPHRQPLTGLVVRLKPKK